MINKTMLLGGVASLVVVGGIAFAMSTAGASTYGYNDEPTHHHMMHHHRMHHARYARNESDRGMRSDEQHARYESTRYEGDRGMMNEGQAPSAFQVRLSSIDHPTDQLRHASVRDADGNTVGYVNDLVTGRDGEIRALKIKVGGLWGYGGKTVTVGANEFRYERDRNELTADMPKKEFDRMPGENEKNGNENEKKG
jgi:hypothetical protein